MSVSNNSNAMWESVIESADLKRHRDIIHLFNWSVSIIKLIGVDYSVLVILFKLIILLLEIVEVGEEVIQRQRVRLVSRLLFNL
jgi:hypothetical protein